jgi:Tfp pilus assembly protein PilF
MEGARLSVAPVQDFAQMGRSVARSGKAKVKKTLLATQPAYSASQLLEKAEELLATCEFDLAKQFCTRALETEPDHAAALEMLVDVEIELGNEDQAMQVGSGFAS